MLSIPHCPDTLLGDGGEVVSLTHRIYNNNNNNNNNNKYSLWSSGQSSWLQIRRPGFDSRHYQKKIVGLERGPLSLVSTTEELLDRKVAAPV
jgi:hypothetical protein